MASMAGYTPQQNVLDERWFPTNRAMSHRQITQLIRRKVIERHRYKHTPIIYNCVLFKSGNTGELTSAPTNLHLSDFNMFTLTFMGLFGITF
jgi:hypothetical protein